MDGEPIQGHCKPTATKVLLEDVGGFVCHQRGKVRLIYVLIMSLSMFFLNRHHPHTQCPSNKRDRNVGMALGASLHKPPFFMPWLQGLVPSLPIRSGWKPSLLGRRPLLLGWRLVAIRSEAMAIRLEAVAIRLEAIEA